MLPARSRTLSRIHRAVKCGRCRRMQAPINDRLGLPYDTRWAASSIGAPKAAIFRKALLTVRFGARQVLFTQTGLNNGEAAGPKCPVCNPSSVTVGTLRL